MVDEQDDRVFKLRDIEAALLRSADRARRIAAETRTTLVIVRDGRLFELDVSRDELAATAAPAVR